MSKKIQAYLIRGQDKWILVTNLYEELPGNMLGELENTRHASIDQVARLVTYGSTSSILLLDPDTLSDKLGGCGIRPIRSVFDATDYGRVFSLKFERKSPLTRNNFRAEKD